jgi:membrane associated rhomboid family serine protease
MEKDVETGAERGGRIRTFSRRVGASFKAGPMAAPFVAIYLIVSWLIFLWFAEPGNWVYETPGDELSTWLYAIPDLIHDTPAALFTMVTAPWVHRTAVQLAFVTFGMLIFGTRLEHREGTIRAAAIFFATTAFGAITAGLLLHFIYPDMFQTRALDVAWDRTWGGGSAGTFGVIGALIGRARNPWPLIGLVALWEGGFALFVYQDYVPAFHIPAFIAGYVATRFLIPGKRDESALTLVTGMRP